MEANKSFAMSKQTMQKTKKSVDKEKAVVGELGIKNNILI